MRPTSGSRIFSIVVAGASAVLLVAIAVTPFLTPPWLGLAQERANAAAWTGYSPQDLRTATDALLHDLVIGPPDFDVVVAGAPVLTERERAHLRDVRAVLGGLALAAVVALVVVVVALARDRAAAWRGIRAGAAALAGTVVVLGVIAAVAFEPAFEVFHRLLFAGNYTFDPRTDRLVQLFPGQLWFETSIAVGVVIVGLAAGIAWAAGRRAARREGVDPGLDVEPVGPRVNPGRAG